MHCTKCDGLMVIDDMIDMQESSIPMWMRGWRCISCGNILDPLIQQHRMVQRSNPLRLIKNNEARKPVFLRPVKLSA